MSVGGAFRSAATCYLGVVLALLGSCCALTVAGRRPLVVTSASMAPALRPGDVVFVAPTQRLVRIGDIVVARDGGRSGRMVSHRVVARTRLGDLVVKGDANARPDPDPVPTSRVVGPVRAVVPYIGLVSLTYRRAPWVALGLLASLALAIGAATARTPTTVSRRIPPMPVGEPA